MAVGTEVLIHAEGTGAGRPGTNAILAHVNRAGCAFVQDATAALPFIPGGTVLRAEE